jgi:ATP-binding cassette subfamily C (CFTR/MRP) protein 1
MLLPRALAAIADSKNAFERLAKVFKAPVMEDEAFSVDPNLDVALKVEGATWEWEETMAEKEKREAAAAKKKGKGGGKVEDSKAEEKGKGKVNDDQQHNETPDKAEKPFSVANVSFTIQKGSLVAIVGPVGCGKSSLLQGLIGEMRRVRCPTSPSFINLITYTYYRSLATWRSAAVWHTALKRRGSRTIRLGRTYCSVPSTTKIVIGML